MYKHEQTRKQTNKQINKQLQTNTNKQTINKHKQTCVSYHQSCFKCSLCGQQMTNKFKRKIEPNGEKVKQA